MTTVSEARQQYPEGYVLGPYRILQLLASGSNGDVYKARHSELGTEAALKVIPIPGNATWEPVFAELMCKPSHGHLVSVHFAERIEDRFVVAMDLVDARTLRDILREQGIFSLADALRICAGVVSALDSIHTVPPEGSLRLAHLCLRPSNIFVEWNGVVRVTDFGISQALGVEVPSTVGSDGLPAYFAPEQLAGAPSPQSDLWAVGILLLEMLFGAAQFHDRTLEEYRTSILEKDLEIGASLANLPAPVVVLILGCLRRNAGERYASARELAAELEAAGSTPAAAKCPKCGAELIPGSDVCPDCTSAQLRAALSQGNPAATQKKPLGIKLDWLTGLIVLAAFAISLSGYLLWQSWQPRLYYATPLPQKPVLQPREPLRSKIPGATTDISGQNPPGALPPAGESAREELKNIQAQEKESFGGYEDRITPLRKFVASHPGTAEARQAQEWLKTWEDEARAFRSADDLERKAGAKMCSILVQWRDFLAHQTTGLRRAYARERIRHWEKEVQEYTGYADLTVHSATGLPASDTPLLGGGRPDPYFVLLEGNKILYRSPTLDNNSSPAWDASVRIYMSPGLIFTLEIWDEDFVGRDLLLGQALMPLPLDGTFQIAQGPITVNLEIQRDR